MVEDYEMKQEDAEVVVVLGALLHCVGMAVHRDRHEDWSLFLAEPKARELLAGIYEEPELTVVVSEVLQAITSHRESGHPLTLEAGIVRVADALERGGPLADPVRARPRLDPLDLRGGDRRGDHLARARSTRSRSRSR